jgi:hypothetical protein
MTNISKVKLAQESFLKFQSELIIHVNSTDNKINIGINGNMKVVSLECENNFDNMILINTINEAILTVSKIIQSELKRVQDVMNER